MASIRRSRRCSTPARGYSAAIAAEVVADYFVYHGQGSPTTSSDMLRRLRADLDMTASKIAPMQ